MTSIQVATAICSGLTVVFSLLAICNLVRVDRNLREIERRLDPPNLQPRSDGGVNS